MTQAPGLLLHRVLNNALRKLFLRLPASVRFLHASILSRLRTLRCWRSACGWLAMLVDCSEFLVALLALLFSCYAPFRQKASTQ